MKTDQKNSEKHKQPLPYVHRDLSWLSFNYRVLQEAKDPTVPLLERLKFLAIYSSNLDEFFRVRVGSHRNLLRVGKKTRQEIDYNPEQMIKDILKIVNRQQEEFSHIFEKQIVPELNKNKIFLKRRLQLTKTQKAFVEAWFNDNMLPYVQPVLLLKGKILPFLNNASLYLMVYMHDKETLEEQFAIVKVPSDHLPRFIELPSMTGRHELIMLDDIVRHCLSLMFPGYDIEDTYSIKLSRDAELYIDDEFTGDLLSKIKTSLAKRQVGPPSRFVYDREMPKALLQFISEMFGLKKDEMLVEGRYHNNFDFFKFPIFGLSHLKSRLLPPQHYKPLEEADNIFEAIREQDHLLAPPYHSYKSVVKFFEDAAKDPDVTHIKITQYRVAKRSHIMDALMEAVEAKKKVFVFIEVKARFDEEANLAWGETLVQAGVKVRYSLPGVKVHAKMGLVRRLEQGKPKFYSYLSTGNFHEETAKVYCDFGLFTYDSRLAEEVGRLFRFLETGSDPSKPFQHLMVGQFGLREKLENLIDREIEHAKKGLPAEIFIKVNSIQDGKIIRKLYEASEAGVRLKMVVRGICSLVPDVAHFSKNIEAISIVDRFLEHARVFIFHNLGAEEIYLSSADWMERNLEFRVETIFPVYDPEVQKIIKDVISLQWRDNVKARIFDKTQSNPYRPRPTNVEKLRSQIETYFYFKNRG